MNKGFTLIELLISVTILAMLILLTGVVISQHSGVINVAQNNMRANAEAAAIAQNLRQDFQSVNSDGFLAIIQATDDTPPAIMLLAIGPFGETGSNVALIIYSLAADAAGKTYLTRELIADPRTTTGRDRASLEALALGYCQAYQSVTVPPTTLDEVRDLSTIMAECSSLRLEWSDGSWHASSALWMGTDNPRLLKVQFTLHGLEYEVIIDRNF